MAPCHSPSVAFTPQIYSSTLVPDRDLLGARPVDFSIRLYRLVIKCDFKSDLKVRCGFDSQLSHLGRSLNFSESQLLYLNG